MLFALGCLVAFCVVGADSIAPRMSVGDDPHVQACEAVKDQDTCMRRCGCEWCPAAQNEGCHTSSTYGPNDGPCAGARGRTDGFWACHHDLVAWIVVAAAMFVIGSAVAVALVVWFCGHRIGVALRYYFGRCLVGRLWFHQAPSPYASVRRGDIITLHQQDEEESRLIISAEHQLSNAAIDHDSDSDDDVRRGYSVRRTGGYGRVPPHKWLPPVHEP